MTGLAQLFSDIATVLRSLYGCYSFSLDKTVTGLDDVSFVGAYTGNIANTSVIIQIDSTGATDTFSFTFGSNTQTGIPIVENTDMDLVDGIHVRFGAKTGHTLNDSWTFNVAGEIVFKTVRLWNNQITKEHEGKYADFSKPACFIELYNTENIEQGGGGMQLYNDMGIKLHIVHEFYDSQDGNFEQDITIFEIKQRAFYALQKKQFDGAATFVRVGEKIDYNHDNIVVYEMDFKTNFEDSLKQEPVTYIIKYPDTNLVETITK